MKNRGRQLTHMGLATLPIYKILKIYEETGTKFFESVPRSIYEKEGSPAHSHGVGNPFYKILKIYVGTSTKFFESIPRRGLVIWHTDEIKQIRFT